MKKLLCIMSTAILAFTSLPVSASNATATGVVAPTSNVAVESTFKKAASLADGMKSVPSTSASAATSASAMTVVSQQAKRIGNTNDWNTFVNSPVIATSSGITGTDYNYNVGRITLSENGTLIVQNGVATSDSSTTYVSIVDSAGKSVDQYKASGVIVVPKAKKGTTYYLRVTCYSKNVTMAARFSAGFVPSANNRTFKTTPMTVGSTGQTMYQQFKVSKRGVATIQAYSYYIPSDSASGMSYDIQKKSGSKWTTVRAGVYTDSSSNYANSFGLNAGTYRIKYKVSDSRIVFVANVNKAVSSSKYGSSKKKAQTIAKSKTKSQVLVAGDATSKKHYYKFKVTSTKSIQIDVTNYGSDGSINFRVSGPSKLSSKKTSSGGLKFYGKAKKGTYYIEVYKTNKKYSGGYKIKYTK